MTVVEDLAAWLTAVWDEEERRYGGHEEDCDEQFKRPCDCIYGVLLARIAADRKILALHAPSGGECSTCCGEPYMEEYWDGEEETVEWKRADLAWPCPTVLLLASPYSERADFRPEWLVERQGVEQ